MWPLGFFQSLKLRSAGSFGGLLCIPNVPLSAADVYLLSLSSESMDACKTYCHRMKKQTKTHVLCTNLQIFLTQERSSLYHTSHKPPKSFPVSLEPDFTVGWTRCNTSWRPRLERHTGRAFFVLCATRKSFLSPGQEGRCNLQLLKCQIKIKAS